MNGPWRILDFALLCLWRQKRRHALTLVVYGFVVFMLASVLMMTSALKHEAAHVLAGAPELIVQKMSAGRHEWIPLSHGEAIKSIRGVRGVSARFWGYYYDPPPGATYTVMGLDSLPLTGTQLLEGKWYGTDESWACVIGQGVAKARLLDPGDILPVKGTDGQLCPLRVTDMFSAASALLTHDCVLLRTAAWRRVFEVPPTVATDLVVDVPNAKEVDTVARKVLERLPDVRVVRREDILKTYDAVFDWRGSVVLLAFAGALAAFGIFSLDRANGSGRGRTDRPGGIEGRWMECVGCLEAQGVRRTEPLRHGVSDGRPGRACARVPFRRWGSGSAAEGLVGVVPRVLAAAA